jgi:hypothetical protein
MALVLTAAGAQARVTVAVSGATLTVVGTDGTDRPLVRYADPVDGTSPGYSSVYDYDGVADPLPPSCTHTDPATGTSWADTAWCMDGGAAPLLTELELLLGGGFDEPQLEACFNVMSLDLGEGDSVASVPPCPAGAFVFSSGAGDDRLSGSIGSAMSLAVDLGDGADAYFGDGRAALSGVVRGGPGNDYLDGSAGGEQLLGGDGDDQLLGRGGDDALDGGAGSDALGLAKGGANDLDPGADDLHGGPGADTLHLDNHPAGMAISLNEVADDGSPGEGDNIHGDIEHIHGTGHADTFAGSPGPDRFDAGLGNDTIGGGGGDDELDGGLGHDRVAGDAGNDRVIGGHDDDTVDGGPGTDALFGDRVQCVYFCPSGNDAMLARDGERDSVECGAGADTAQVDAVDVVAAGGFEACDAIDRPGAPPQPGPGATSNAFRVRVVGKPSIARGVRASVTCPAACRFAVSVRLGAKAARRYGVGRHARTLGRVRGALRSGGRARVRVRVSATAKRRLRRARRVPATLRASVKDGAGKRTTKTRSITLGR